MYQQKAFECIDKAAQASKKESPKTMIFCLVAGILLAINGVSLLGSGAGIMIRTIGPEVSGLLSIVVAGFLFYGAFSFAKDTAKSSGQDANLSYREDYMDMVRALGDENDVFAHLESLEPIVGETYELRYDKDLVACLCDSDTDRNFVYPMEAMVATGSGELGSRSFLYMHFMVDGKKLKKSLDMPEDQADAIVVQFKKFNPNVKVGE